MSVTANKSLDAEQDLQAELDELRQGLLPMLLPAVLTLGWLWCVYVTWHQGPLMPHYVPGFLVALAAYAAHRLRARHFLLTSWILLSSMVVANALVVALYPGVLAVTFGVLAIIIANPLVGTPGALLVATLAWTAQIGVRWLILVEFEPPWTIGETVLLYCLSWGAVWLAGRPLRISVGWALSGWNRARAALDETRERRAELYRVVRALEEATYRIERMNNELLIARGEAEEARALKAQFAATVSHELRGPLSMILGFSKLMALSPERYGGPLPSAYRADIDAVYRNSQHLVSLVDDVLDLSQIEARRMALSKSHVDLEEDVIKWTVGIVQPLAQRKGLYLRQELTGNLPTILADPARLNQALLNLLTNAVRFTERGGITVRTMQDGNSLVVSVDDTGPGIPADEMPKLFKEFQRIQVTETREAGGTGLGLSISKHFIELHGGEIKAESVLGKGTTFTVKLPLTLTSIAAAPTAATRAVQYQTAIPSCLIVHDDPSFVRLLARHLEGYRVVGVPDEQEVIALTEELHPRAIIAADEVGERIAAQLSRTPYDVPIVTCSLPHLAMQARLNGTIGHLIKPFAAEMVAAVMRKVERNGETTILLVDDEPDAVRLLERMLTSIPRPYNIMRAYDGLQALELMRDTVPDVVFLDLVMPGLDGRETIARMRADERLAGVPVVIVSARDWADETIALQAPIVLRYRHPVSVVKGARCLLGIFEVLSPHYLPEPLSPAEPPAASPQ